MSRDPKEKPARPGIYVHCAAGYAGPYRYPGDAQAASKGVGVVVTFRECPDCRELHSGHYQPCDGCSLAKG